MNRLFRGIMNKVAGLCRILAAVLPLCCVPLQAVAQQERVANDTVMASLLVASPGSKVYQVMGHAAIRLQCPAYGLDNVFSYETDTDGGIVKHLLGKAKGKFGVLVFEEYESMFKEEGRGIREYPLNLSDSQIRLLWQRLDKAIESGVEGEFNIRRASCIGLAMAMIDGVAGRERIVMCDSVLANLDNATTIRDGAEHRPWATAVLAVGLGADADVADFWHWRIYIKEMDRYFGSVEIVSPDGSVRPFVAGAPRQLCEATADVAEHGITPAALALIMLLIAVALSVAEMTGKCRRVVAISDRGLLLLQSVAAIAVIAVAVTPASIGAAWNWMFIPFNLIPGAAWLLWRGTPLCRRIYIVYGLACAAFIAAPLWTSEADVWSSILSVAIAVRVLFHCFVKR